jgi:sulfite exporter TauE/SafE
MFVLGLGTSLHCVSMCGPLVLTYAVKGEEDGPWYRKLTPNVAYQGAKVVSYMLVGLLLGTLGGFLNLDALRPYVYYLAGVFMIVLGLGMTGKVPWAARLTPRPPKWLMNTLMKLRRKSVADAEEGHSSLATPVTFGLMTGLLPCGPLMAAQVAAAASGSAVTGALGMAAFAVGTAPLMVAFGTAGSLIPRVWKQRMMTALAIGVVVFGLVFINRGLIATGSPVTFLTLQTAITGGPADTGQYATGADGVVEIPIVIENVQFLPQVVQIPADTPVRLVVDRREANACSDQIYLPQLNILAELAPNGVTAVDIPATAAGSYTLTCGMSMMAGQLVVGGGSSGGSLGSPVLWIVLAVSGAVGSLVVAQRRDARIAAASAKRGTAAPTGLFGFKPLELALIAATVAAAVLAGLSLGGSLQ